MMNSGMKRTFAALVLAGFTLAACAEGREQEGLGTLIGAGLGAWIGHEIGDGSRGGEVAGTALGTLIGAGIGQQIGRKLDRADRLAMAQARYRALEYTPSGERTTWENPDSGHTGWYEPSPAYEFDGSYCREYTQTIIIGGEKETGYGTACRQPDGSWKIVG